LKELLNNLLFRKHSFTGDAKPKRLLLPPSLSPAEKIRVLFLEAI